MSIITCRLLRHTIFNGEIKLRNGHCLCSFLDADLDEIEQIYQQLTHLSCEDDPSFLFERLVHYTTAINRQILGILPYDAFNCTDEISKLAEQSDCAQIHKTLKYYISLCEGVLRTKYYFKEYIDHYHFKYGIPVKIEDCVKPYTEYMDTHHAKHSKHTHPPYYFATPPYVINKSHVILDYTNENGTITKRIQEQLDYQHIGDFLDAEFTDIFRGRLLIKKCLYCGKHFIMNAKYNIDYCDNIAPGESKRTCRDVSAQKIYAKKVKNNPILLAFQRSYKAKYARVSKGLLSKREFFEWSENARCLRDMALNGELDFYAYLELLSEK